MSRQRWGIAALVLCQALIIGTPRVHAMEPRNATEACIDRRENGGSYGRSSNPNHFGRWQYDRRTWEAHGGRPEDWGHASPEEQDRVFRNGVAKYGYGSWTPYDGCGGRERASRSYRRHPAPVVVYQRGSFNCFPT